MVWKLISVLVLLIQFSTVVPVGLAREPSDKSRPSANVMWRYDGSGRFPDIRPPAEWRADKNIVWKAPVEIGGYSSPIVAAGKVFVTAEMGSLFCLDLADGKLLWKKDLFSKDSKDLPAELSRKLMRGCGGDSKQSTPTPTSNGEQVFYINAMGLCACYDLQGRQQWIQIIETAEEEEYFSSSPIFHGDRIILTWGCLLALNAKDGTILWKAEEAKPTHGTPLIARIGGTEVVITPAGDIVRIDDGEILCSKLFESTFSTPMIEGNILYVIDAKARALELPDKPEKGMRLKEVWNTKLKGSFMASPVYRDGLIYTLESQKCRVVILDAKTGALLTSTKDIDDTTKAEKLEPGVKIDGLTRAQFAYASPVATKSEIYYFDDTGNTAVLHLGREHRLARINKLDDTFIGTPFFVDDKIIIRGRETVYCLGVTP